MLLDMFKRKPLSISARRARTMSSAQLADSIEIYVSSAGQALRLYQEHPNLLFLEVLNENVDVLQVLSRELYVRAEERGVPMKLPAVDPHVEELRQKYLRGERAEPVLGHQLLRSDEVHATP
jgi:hypothetical protein